MFVTNSWYLAAWSDELQDRPLGLLLLKQPIVLFRKKDGSAVALEDRCVHRHVPLSIGTVVDNWIECIYHGFTYDEAGACVKIPGQDRIPATARVRSYPIMERYGCIFLWMGDPKQVSPSLLPDFSWLSKQGFGVTRKHVHVKAHYQLIVDNLLDLSHLAFLHASTVGQRELADKAEIFTEVDGNRVRVTRWTKNVPAVRTYKQFGGFTGNVDRWQISEFISPCFFVIDNGAAVARTGAPEGREGKNRWGFHVCHGISPESESTTHYFWALSHEFQAKEEELMEFYRQQHSVVGEDLGVFEAQQKTIELMPNAPSVSFKYDAGPIQARKMIERLIDMEAGGFGVKGSPASYRP